MTIDISNNAARVNYTVASGVTQTSFSVPFEFFNDSDLSVYVDDVLKTITTHYTVSGGDGSTGTITMSVTGAAGGSTVVISRSIAIERTSDFQTGVDINRAALNTQLDTLTAIAADNQDKANRSITAPNSEVNPVLELPDADTRKGKLIGFNETTGNIELSATLADGNTLASISGDIATLADIEDGTDATDAIQTVAGISSNVTTVAGISSNVTSVAGNESNINTVAGDGADIGTVAGSIASVNTAAANITEIQNASANAATATTKAAEAATSETNASTSETNAATSETNAATSASTATTQAGISTTKATESAVSAAAALSSENAAATSESNALTSESNASTSATASETSKVASVAAQAAAETAEANAETSETNAASSASAASTSASNASTSETNAAASESVATTQAGISTTKAAESAASAAASLASQNAASTSEANSATSEGNAATSATASETSRVASVAAQVASEAAETNAETAQTAAEAAQTAAETAETNAATSETNAANSATSASTDAATATTKAGEASTSASNAASSASSAQASKDAALSALDSFDDRYLGQKTADPTLDNDGDALVSGALYFNTTDDIMKVYDGSQWVAAYASLSGAMFGANNLSDVADAAGSRANLGLVIGTNVQAFSAILQSTTASYTTAEETKLAGIEANATADQTPAQIKTAYESNANTNEFSDAEQTKLAGIEAGATGDQTASEIRSLVEAATDSNVFTDADHNKLNAIEANAKDDQTITAGSGLTGGGTGNVTLNHADTSSVSNANNSGNTFIQDINFDGFGHVTSVGTGTVSVGNGTLTVQGTGALGGSGTFTANQSGDSTISISHDDTSSQASVDNSGATVIQDVTLDGYGHVTGIGSHTLTLANLGYTGATNANYITNNNQLTNGAGYVNTSDSRLTDARQCNNTFNNPTTSRNNLGLGTGNGVTFASVTAGTFNTTSDRNTKKNIKPIENALDKVQQLGGYNFTFKHNDEKSSGVIAQEVQKVMPELVQEGGEGHLTVQYGNMVGLLIEAIKEQQVQIDELKAQLNS